MREISISQTKVKSSKQQQKATRNKRSKEDKRTNKQIKRKGSMFRSSGMGNRTEPWKTVAWETEPKSLF